MTILRQLMQCIVLALVAIVIAGPQSAASAQVTEDAQTLKRAIEALHERQERLEHDVAGMKRLLARPTESPKTLALHDAPFRGSPDAKIVIVEFSDYQCPFCARHVRDTWPRLENEFISRGTAAYVVRDLPVERIHPRAGRAAEASHCAGDQGRYWQMRDVLFANQRALRDEDLTKYAATLGATASQFRECLDSGKHADRVRRDVSEGQRLGVRGTPTFVIGKRQDPSTVVVLRVLRGAVAFPVFKSAIEAVLASP